VPGKIFILIPPSEAKAPGGSSTAKFGTFDGALGDVRAQVIGALAELVSTGTNDSCEKTLRVRGPLLERALASTNLLVARRAPLLPAWRRYSGVVWSALDPATLTIAQRRAMLIPSGLYGVTSGNDLIADYRLKMDTSLAPLGNMARFWRPHVTSALVNRIGKSVVINLLPKEHEASIDWTALEAECDVIKFTFAHSDGRGAVGHSAKAVKGVLARKLLDDGLRDLESFEFDGWRIRRSGEQFLVVAAPRS
jgi:hypothetical protein